MSTPIGHIVHPSETVAIIKRKAPSPRTSEVDTNSKNSVITDQHTSRTASLDTVPHSVGSSRHKYDSHSANNTEISKRSHAAGILIGLQKVIWIAGVSVGFLRASVVASLEAVTALILEGEFAWSVENIGIVIGCTFLCSLPVAFFMQYLLNRGSITTWQSIRLCCAVVFGWSFFLMPSVSRRIATAMASTAESVKYVEPFVVLAADAFVFSFFYFGSSVLDGVANIAAVSGRDE
jgi:hypothetical protein